MTRRIVLEHEYPHPPALVWRALTEPDLIERWLMTNDFRPEVGAEFQFKADPQPGWDGVVRCRVLEVEVERRLRYTWVGGPLDTELSMTLTPTAHGTRLRVEHTGFEGFSALLVSFILQAGSRRMYRRALAGVLDALARGETPGDEIHACREKGAWRVLAAVFAPILKRGEKAS